jgi:hypothetical protein
VGEDKRKGGSEDGARRMGVVPRASETERKAEGGRAPAERAEMAVLSQAAPNTAADGADAEGRAGNAGGAGGRCGCGCGECMTRGRVTPNTAATERCSLRESDGNAEHLTTRRQAYWIAAAAELPRVAWHVIAD